jgi:hypothetical protein
MGISCKHFTPIIEVNINMKKQIIVTLTFILALTLLQSAYAQEVSPSPTPEVTTSPTPTPEPTVTASPEPTNITTPTPEPTATPTVEPTVTPTQEPTASPAPTNGTTITIPSIPEFGRLEATTIMIGVTTALAVAFTVVKKRKTPTISN